MTQFENTGFLHQTGSIENVYIENCFSSDISAWLFINAEFPEVHDTKIETDIQGHAKSATNKQPIQL